MEIKLGNLKYSNPFLAQSVNVMNAPFYSNSLGSLVSSGHTIHDMTQSTPTINSERSGIQSVFPGNLPVISGYSPVQLQLLLADSVKTRCRIVCACHGTHMSPEECTKPDINICLATFPSTNPAASAQS
ncbi:hypothetical protein HRI_005272500 [Hibiscus trionum]|uniref:Uncharacterized protein n=1 Tax=Hibiscus trionum TaxID=183268 RepID=A0A9W7JM41_HIBTR|nr:hypothetical protein HRI_005272500 [Hibiscus trionum]